MTSTLLSDYVPTGEFPKVDPAVVVPPPRMSDEQAATWRLVERAQAGGPDGTAAFGELYGRYVDTVYRFIWFRIGKHRQMAEDLTSDTFLRALRSIGNITWQGRDPGAWIITIARNLVADHFKSASYRLVRFYGDAELTEHSEVDWRGVEGRVVDYFANVELWRAVEQLTGEQRECVVLRFGLGLSVAETAAAMGKNQGAIKAVQYRAVRSLARLLPDGFLTGEEPGEG